MEYKVVIFLCGLTIFTFADSCKYKKTEGERLEIKLEYLNLNDKDELKWTKKDNNIKKLVLHKKRGAKLKPDETGSLVISSVKMENASTYDVEVYKDGRLEFNRSIQVCVYEKLNKPMVNFTCDKKIIKVACILNFKYSVTPSFKWLQNGKDMKKNQENLEISNQEDAQNYECIISNEMSSSQSDKVKVTCAKSTLFGIDFWLMVAILAAGGGLVLVLTIVLLSCSCYRCRQKKQHQKDEEELRLSNLPLQYCHPKSSHTARGQPAPPVPEYEESTHPTADDSGKRNQRFVRPPPPPVDDDEQPPPLPQPRKKVHTKNNSGIVS